MLLRSVANRLLVPAATTKAGAAIVIGVRSATPATSATFAVRPPGAATTTAAARVLHPLERALIGPAGAGVAEAEATATATARSHALAAILPAGAATATAARAAEAHPAAAAGVAGIRTSVHRCRVARLAVLGANVRHHFLDR